MSESLASAGGEHAGPDPALPAEARPAPGDAPPPPTVADGIERPLDPRYLLLQRQVGWILTACCVGSLMIAVPILMLVGDLPPWGDGLMLAAALAAAVGVAWLTRVWPAVEHRHASYRVGPEAIEIRRGVVWRHVISVPRSRIQHTDVSQGPVERRFGLGTLSLFTAGTEHEKVDLPGLDHARALAIRDALAPSDRGDAV